MLREIRTAAELLNWRKVGIRLGDCPVCGRTGFVKLDDYEMAVRCLRCRSSAATLSFVSVLKDILPDLSRRHVYELSSRGPLVGYLRRQAGKLTLSEYFDDVPPGQYKAGVQCQDVQQLTYGDGCFDVCTSTEVFEHVPHDLEGFRELHRVLSPGGLLLFTVPMDGGERTVERARLVNGRLEHLLPPEYHGDRIRGSAAVLCFRNYGTDILDRLGEAGFSRCRLVRGEDVTGWGFDRQVVVARK
ncbi:MAG: class I SAM-dependent methyltransferase [Acidobacteriota bacterium]|nr:class I SAM-dependent methyltransferase [Acidobacteriota bacterium]